MSSLNDLKRMIVAADLDQYVRDLNVNNGEILLRLIYIENGWDEIRDLTLDVLSKFAGSEATYRDGFYKVKVPQLEAAKPRLPKDQQEIGLFTTAAGEPVEILTKKSAEPEKYAGKEVKTGIPKIDEKHAVKEKTAEELAAGEIVLVEVGKIQPNSYNPNEMGEEEFEALRLNMQKEGPQGTDPLQVRPLQTIGSSITPAVPYEVIDGYHRWKTATILGWKKVRCIIREVEEDRAQEINYAKNKLRGHINPWKEAEMFYRAVSKIYLSSHVGTQKEVARRFGVSEPYISDALALRRIPDEVQKIIPRGVNRSLLEILARLEDPSDQEALAMEIASGITVRQAEDFVKNLKTADEKVGTKTRKAAHMDISIERHSPGGVFKEVWYSFGYATDIPNSHQGGASPFTEEQDWEALIGKDVKRIEDSSGYRIIPRVIMDYRTWNPEDTLETLEKGGGTEARAEPAISKIPEGKSPEVKALPCFTCSNDSEKGGMCFRTLFHVDDAGDYVCEGQNKNITAEGIPASETAAATTSAIPTAIPTPLPTAIPAATPAPLPATDINAPSKGKKNLYYCTWCRKDREEYEVSHVHGNTCGVCGHQVVVLATYSPIESAVVEQKIPPVPFREAMSVSESAAEVKLGVALQKLKLEGRIDDIGRTQESIPFCIPDRVWIIKDEEGRVKKRIALFLDGDKVHKIGDEWDDLVDKVLLHFNWTILRERYTAPISQKRLNEILAKVLEALGK